MRRWPLDPEPALERVSREPAVSGAATGRASSPRSPTPSRGQRSARTTANRAQRATARDQHPRRIRAHSNPGTPGPGHTGGMGTHVIAVVGATATGKSEPGHRAGPRPRRRGRERRLDAALPGHGHRHRQGARGRLARRPASPARHLAGDPGRQRGRLPEAGPRRDRRDHRPRPGAHPGRRLGPVRPGRPGRPGFPRNGPGDPRSSRARAHRPGRPGPARPAGPARPGRGRGHPAEQRPPDRARPGGDRDIRAPVHRHHAGLRAEPPGRPDRAHPAPARARPADRRPGRPDVAGGPGGRGQRAWSPRACATAGPPAARSATSRSCATWTASGPWRKPGWRRSRPPSGSPAARNPGSAATPASAGSTPASPPRPSWPRRSRSYAARRRPGP